MALYVSGSKCWSMTMVNGFISLTISAFHGRNHLVNIVGFCILMGNILCMPMFSEDPIFRHRAMGVLCVIWRMALPVYAKRMKVCIILQGIMLAVEFVATWVTLSHFGEAENIVRIT